MLKLLMFVCAKRLMDTVSSNEASLSFERTVVLLERLKLCM